VKKELVEPRKEIEEKHKTISAMTSARRLLLERFPLQPMYTPGAPKVPCEPVKNVHFLIAEG
jgi:hypothetical protein